MAEWFNPNQLREVLKEVMEGATHKDKNEV
jgi:hypothetical protein